MEQAIQKIDHVAFVVYKENLEKYVQRLSEVLGITFDEPTVVESTGVVAALSWDSGLEVLAPLENSGRFWDRLQKYGEGTTIIVFGVKDMDEGKRRAAAAGALYGTEVKLGGTEPWYDRFSVFREVGLSVFDKEMPHALALSQIEPKW